MKKIAFNALVMNEQAGGLGVYIRKIMDHLLFNSVPFEPIVYLSESWCKQNPQYLDHPQVKCVSINPRQPILRIFKDPFFWPYQLQKYKIDLFFSPMSYIPMGVNIPGIVTIHDLRSFHFPEYYTFVRYHYLKWSIQRSARRAKKIIAVSNFTKSDIIQNLDVKSEKISVIHEGISEKEFSKSYSPKELYSIKKKYNIDKPFLLSIGHLEPRKNYKRLIDAFAILKNKYAIEHDLVIVGQENWNYKDIFARVAELGLNNSIHFTKFVEQDHISALYQLADVFVTVSTFEGFGFTPLESMAAGTPVVVSNCTSLPEIVGDSALLCDPDNENDIASSVYRLLSDSKLQQQYVDRGIQHVKHYQWKQCIDQTMKELELL